ncbi:2291_t:CDS:1, partial [Acaulospora colombiana]
LVDLHLEMYFGGRGGKHAHGLLDAADQSTDQVDTPIDENWKTPTEEHFDEILGARVMEDVRTPSYQ